MNPENRKNSESAYNTKTSLPPCRCAAEVKQFNGVPTLFINEQPHDGLMHWNRWAKPIDVANFRKADIHLFSFIMNIWLGPEHDQNTVDDTVPMDGRMLCPTLNPAKLDEFMSRMLEGNPDLLVMPRIRLNPPQWWMDRHPDELMRHYDLDAGEYVPGKWAAITSTLWRETVLSALVRTMEQFETRWGDHVFGYHIGWGDCVENSYRWSGCPFQSLSDYSQPQQEAFRRWVREKYSGVDALRQAWNDPEIDFKTVTVPPPELRVAMARKVPYLFDPATEGYAIDYQIFHSEAMAEALCLAAKTVKTTLKKMGREKICGGYYGYHAWGSRSLGIQEAGHNAHDMVFSSPDIDFICAPLGYQDRQTGGYILHQILPASIAANGKLYYAEEDTGTQLDRWLKSKTISHSVHALRRNFLGVWREGATQWWMDLRGCEWFHQPEIMEELGHLRRFAARTLARRQSQAEIAVFASDRSMAYFRGDLKFGTSGLIVKSLLEITGMGASYDLLRVEDMPVLVKDGRHKQYKFCIFLDTVMLSDAVRTCIEENLAADSRTLLWTYAPGVVHHGQWSEKAASQLTGMEFDLDTSFGSGSLQVEAWLRNRRMVYGIDHHIFPRLIGHDNTAEILGFYVEASRLVSSDPQRGDAPAVMRKKFPGWTSIWSAAPNVPAALLMQFAEEAGVHIYSHRGDQIFAGPGWLGVHSKLDGDIELVLPKPATITDAITGETIGNDMDAFRLPLQRGETRVFNLE